MGTLKRVKPYQNKKNYYQALNAVKREGKDILRSQQFIECSDHMQHGTMSVRKHCINVAQYSVIISQKLGVTCNQRELIRGALLHDYFLYDWHVKRKNSWKKLHGFYHPGIALTNAEKEYELSLREKDIIKKHMWPLTIKPPLCREAWIVTAADKYCSFLETIRIHKG